MRRGGFTLLLAACALGESQAPAPTPQPVCAEWQRALEATQRVLDERSLQPLGLLLDPMLLTGRIDPELAALMEDPQEVEPFLGGDRLRPAFRAALALVDLHPASELIDPILEWLQGEPLDTSALGELATFLVSDRERLAVVNPVRKMLSDCGEGRPLAQAIADATGYQMSCGSTLVCLAEQLGELAADPALSEALSSLTLEGEEGRKAFGVLVAQIMNASAQPAFDVAQTQGQLRQLFEERLPESSLARLDRILSVVDEHFSDPQRRATWRQVVTCTERHDPTYAVSGLVYDVVIREELELASLLPANSSDASALVTLNQPLHRVAQSLAEEDGMRLALNAAVEPILTGSVMKLLVETLDAPELSAALDAWLAWFRQEGPCESR